MSFAGNDYRFLFSWNMSEYDIIDYRIHQKYETLDYILYKSGKRK